MKNLIRLLCVLGFLVSVVFAESLDDTRKKAESGDAAAQFSLGLKYANGNGVPKDSAEAVKWYRRSADQGNFVAQTILGMMYRNGEGVPKDLVQAHVWWNIAGAAGNEGVKKHLATLEKEMTSDQKAEATKLARELFAKLPKKK
jgi:TPR repeat protein